MAESKTPIAENVDTRDFSIVRVMTVKGFSVPAVKASGSASFDIILSGLFSFVEVLAVTPPKGKPYVVGSTKLTQKNRDRVLTVELIGVNGDAKAEKNTDEWMITLARG